MTDEPIESIPGYSNLTRIGMGGSGVVFRARQQAFDRDVAVKVLRGDFDESARRRFLREARLTGRLTGHPNVVTALDAGTTDSGHPYLAMDLFEQGSLQDRLAGSGPFPAPEVASIGAKIAAALADAHALGMVHRDVKPNNILVSRFGEPALADFGVAVVPDGPTVVTMFSAFTPHHAAPEVINGADATARSDVYSLGSTLYHLLTGTPPFAGDDNGAQLSALLYRIVNSPPPPLACPELPGLAAIVMRALSKAPTERPESAAAMAAELQELAGAGMRLSTTMLTMPPRSAYEPTHRAQAEGAGPGFAGVPGIEAGAVGPFGTVEDSGPGEVTVHGAGARSQDPAAGFGGQVGRPAAPPVIPQGGLPPALPISTAGFVPPLPDPKRSAAGFEAPPPQPPQPPEPPVEAPRGLDPVEPEQRRRRPMIIGASAAAAVVVAIGGIALAQGSSGSKNANGTRSGAAMGPGDGGDSDSGSRPTGQDVAENGPLPSSTGASAAIPGGPGSSQSGPGGTGNGGTPTHGPTSAPGSTAAPAGQPTGTAGPSSAPVPPSTPQPSTTPPKPPTTSTSSKNMTCTGWHITHVVADDGDGYAATGTFTMRSGPYSACSAVGKFTTGQHMYIWCHVTNGYGNVWVYGRIEGTSTPAWQSKDNFKSGITVGPAC